MNFERLPVLLFTKIETSGFQTLPFFCYERHYSVGSGCRPFRLQLYAPDTRAGGGAPAMESRLSTLATCGFGVRTSLEATTG